MSRCCPYNGCPVTNVPDDQLLCPRHWHQVPKPIRRAVWIAWNRSKGAGTLAHTAAVRLAIAAINRVVVPASSLKHPACGPAVESQPQAGLVSSHDPEVIR